MFNVWDVDDDDVIVESEWETGVDYLYEDDLDPGVFDDWDVNSDSELDLDEVSEGLDTTQWNEDWYTDADPVVGYDEFLDDYYALWDLDDDGLVDTVEYYDGLEYWTF
ncbi:MAG: hypothetical protein ACN0LA_06340 [Candidatus Longimicrobiales bacterium M2_2A_002]